jgi:hypothetical protein
VDAVDDRLAELRPAGLNGVDMHRIEILRHRGESSLVFAQDARLGDRRGLLHVRHRRQAYDICRIRSIFQ